MSVLRQSLDKNHWLLEATKEGGFLFLGKKGKRDSPPSFEHQSRSHLPNLATCLIDQPTDLAPGSLLDPDYLGVSSPPRLPHDRELLLFMLLRRLITALLLLLLLLPPPLPTKKSIMPEGRGRHGHGKRNEREKEGRKSGRKGESRLRPTRSHSNRRQLQKS